MSDIRKDTYTFVEKPGSELYSVRINDGLYRGVIVTYGKVKLYVNPESDEAHLDFTFMVNEVPNPMTEEELEASIDFKNFLGDILQHILDSSFDSGRYRLGGPLVPKKHGVKSTGNDSPETRP